MAWGTWLIPFQMVKLFMSIILKLNVEYCNLHVVHVDPNVKFKLKALHVKCRECKVDKALCIEYY